MKISVSGSIISPYQDMVAGNIVGEIEADRNTGLPLKTTIKVKALCKTNTYEQGFNEYREVKASIKITK